VTGPVPAAVLLDFGGVLWDMRWDVCRALEDEHGLPRGSVFQTLYRSDSWRDIERGRGDVDAWRSAAHRALEATAGRALPPLHEKWRASQALLQTNVDLVRRLRPRYRLAVVSNADCTLRSRLADGLGIASLFDEVICSAEVGLAKPDAGIYLLASQRLEVPPADCVFVDDHEPNVRAAEALGIRSILHRADRGDDLRAQLTAVGIGR
jgi:putative hydrolase of the HAD superfamily